MPYSAKNAKHSCSPLLLLRNPFIWVPIYSQGTSVLLMEGCESSKEMPPQTITDPPPNHSVWTCSSVKSAGHHLRIGQSQCSDKSQSVCTILSCKRPHMSTSGPQTTSGSRFLTVWLETCTLVAAGGHFVELGQCSSCSFVHKGADSRPSAGLMFSFGPPSTSPGHPRRAAQPEQLLWIVDTASR